MASVWLAVRSLGIIQCLLVDVKQPYLIESKSGFSLFLSFILAIHFFAGIHKFSLTLFIFCEQRVASFIRNSEYANWPLFGSRDVELASVLVILVNQFLYQSID